MLVIGMITGTSFDGIEAAAGEFELDGDVVRGSLVGARSRPFGPELRAEIEAVLPPHATTVEAICRLDKRLGCEFAEAALALGSELPSGQQADLVVSAGQTVYHWVDGHSALGTLQLGQAAWIAEATGLPVLSDVRATDVAAGGHGAPMASLLDVLLLGDAQAPTAALNLGGIANITVLRPGAPPVAFDTGPANALMDAAVRAMTGGREHFDGSGRRATAGTVDRKALDLLLDEPYYREPWPKSTGKEIFHPRYVDELLGGDRQPEGDDLIATLTALTVETIARDLERFGVEEVVVSGGGVQNATLMRWLADRLPRVRWRVFDELGVPADAKEAFTFALMGYLSVSGLPGAIASCTGARRDSVVGTLTPPAVPGAAYPGATARPRALILS